MKSAKRIVMLLLIASMLVALTACGSTAAKPEAAAQPATETTEAAPAAPAGDPITMVVGLGVPTNHFEYEAMVKMKEYVEKESNGMLIMDLYPDTALGDDFEVMELIKTGDAHMCVPGMVDSGNVAKACYLLSYPMLFPDNLDAINAIQDSEVFREILDTIEDSGYISLGTTIFGARCTMNTVHPISSLDDYKNLKIRTTLTPVKLKFYEAIGAAPIAMAWGETVPALQQGVIDALDNPLPTLTANFVHEIADYLTLDSTEFTLMNLMLGKDFFYGLPEEYQQILRDGARIAQLSTRESYQTDYDKALALMEEYGTQISVLSEDARAEMREVAMEIAKEHAAENGMSELFDKLLAEIDTQAAKFAS